MVCCHGYIMVVGVTTHHDYGVPLMSCCRIDMLAQASAGVLQTSCGYHWQPVALLPSGKWCHFISTIVRGRGKDFMMSLSLPVCCLLCVSIGRSLFA